VSSAAKYWQLVKLDTAGRRRVEIMVNAKHYFHQQFPVWVEQAEVPDTLIQQELLQRLKTDERNLAELCFRCYISYQVDQVCRDLALKFGDRSSFTHLDMLPILLDDDGRPSERTHSSSFWVTVLQTFDPVKASLSTWVNLQVKQHPEVKRFLLDHGVYLMSNWAILSDTKLSQLQRVLAEIYQLTDIEIQYTSALLQSFHAIYREDRLKARLAANRKACQPPTSEQLERIAEAFYERTQKRISPEALLNQLNAIAAKLRRVRIVARGGSIDAISLDQPEIRPRVEQIQTPPEDEEASEFLKFYQAQFLACFDAAIAQVIQDVLAALQRKRKPVEQAFLKALHLFHCQSQSMSEIAPQIGLKKQYEVTRLLKLNDLRTDIRQRSLATLRDRVLDQAKLYANAERLQQLDQQVDTILTAQISGVIEEAEAEAQSPNRTQSLPSLFARRLCQYLATRESSHV
jgi:hypothetical protein